METQAKWVILPNPTVRKSIYRLFSHFSLMTQGVLLDGALISEMKSPIVIPNNTKNQPFLALQDVEENERFTAYNPGIKKISAFLPDSIDGHDLALCHESGGFSIQNAVEMEGNGFIRLVSYAEALRYIGISKSEAHVADAQKKSEAMSRVLEGGVYQVTREGSVKIRLIMQKKNFFPQFPFSGGSGSLRNRKPLHV